MTLHLFRMDVITECRKPVRMVLPGKVNGVHGCRLALSSEPRGGPSSSGVPPRDGAEGGGGLCWV